MENRTKLFFDTEFTGLHSKTTLISIGIYSENNQYFYAEFTDYDKSQLDDWLNENIINKLLFNELKSIKKITKSENNKNSILIKSDTEAIKNNLITWLSQFESVEFWSDCLAYDWVLFNNIFGHAFSIPKNVYYIPFDICTLFRMKNIDPDISRIEFANTDAIYNELNEVFNIDGDKHHNSLYDAALILQCYKKLTA